MSGCCDNLPGGLGTNKVKETASSETHKLQEQSYKAKLRPRPTPQTEHFRSSFQPNKSLDISLRKRSRPSSVLPGICAKGKELESKSSFGSEFSVSTKRNRSTTHCGQATLLNRSPSQHSGSNNSVKVKETAKLWFPFIAPVPSSDSEQEDSLGQIDSDLTVSKKTVTGKKTIAAQRTKKEKIETKFLKYMSEERQQKNSKRKNTKIVRNKKNTAKFSKNLQYNLNCNRSSSKVKTGSCASTSRRGRGKSVSHSSQEQEQEQEPENSRMSRDNSPSNDPASNTNNAGAQANSASENEADLDEQDMTRLQALLEARGLPSHFFGTLGPRVQQILHRSINSNTNSKAQQLLQGMQSTSDESHQLQSVIEMCQLLVMGNEDTLAGFPIKSVVPVLIKLLQLENNFDIMNHACRALTYMMEALPKSSSIVVDAVPVFLNRLQSIQCMDVAEQSLTALEMLSRRHGAAILKADGLSSCLLYLDFFSLPAQRNALTIVANCCSVPPFDDQKSVFDKYYACSITLLTQRLSHHDKKCVESVCLCFARLVNNFHNEPTILRKTAENGLLQSLQSLLVVTPPLIGESMFVLVIKTMSLMCSSCPDLANQLVSNNIAATLRYLLCGKVTETEQIELVQRSPHELYEITFLISKLLPKIPWEDTLYNVHSREHQIKSENQTNTALWQWKTNDGGWNFFLLCHDVLIEKAYQNGDQEIKVEIQERRYTLNFQLMQQANEETGTTRAIRKKQEVLFTDNQRSQTESLCSVDTDKNLLVKENSLISEFVQSLFTLLYEVYGTAAGSPALRHQCLCAMQRMLFYAEPNLLEEVLKTLSISSHIASMLSSYDLTVLVGALQMAMILMKKLPKVFEIYFLREGVKHQIETLLDPGHKVIGINQKAGTSNSSTSTPRLETAFKETASRPDSTESMSSRLSDKFRKKYSPRRSMTKRLQSTFLGGSEDQSRADQSKIASSVDQVVSPPLTKAKAFAAAMAPSDDTVDPPRAKSKSQSSSSNRTSAGSFFFNLNPTKWGRSTTSLSSGNSQHSINPFTIPSESSLESSSSSANNQLICDDLSLANRPNTVLINQNQKEKLKKWIRENAKLFLESYFRQSGNKSSPSANIALAQENSILNRLSAISGALLSSNSSNVHIQFSRLCDIINNSDVSPFEIQHSGIIMSLLSFLTMEDNKSTQSSNLEVTSKHHVKHSSMITRRRSKTDIKQTSDVNKKSQSIENISSTYGCVAQKDNSPDCRSFQRDPVFLRNDRLRSFLHAFVGLPVSYFCDNEIHLRDSSHCGSIRILIQKLNLCVNQLEQFSVNSHDFSNTSSRVSQALQFFSKHHLKCQLQRHQNCEKSKVWNGGPVKVDPLALVQAIERYLLTRGFGLTVSDTSDPGQPSISTEDDSEDEIEVNGKTDEDNSKHATPQKYHLDLYIGSNKLPSNMTVYQAVKKFGCRPNVDHSMSIREHDGNNESLFAGPHVWNSTHTIQYMLVPNRQNIQKTNESQHIPAKYSSKRDSFWQSGIPPTLTSPLYEYLKSELSPSFSTFDPCQDVLALLKVLYGLSRYWHTLYEPSAINTDRQLLSNCDFVNNKLVAKCRRQLLDPLLIMTGELPPWMTELAHACPFILSFEVRQILFRITSFDRDHAMQYLLETGTVPELTTNATNSSSLLQEPSNRILPKIEKIKGSVHRDLLLTQAEKLIKEHAHERSLLEIQFNDEVGTGLGPTLEFYTLTSHELQRSNLGLWRCEENCDVIESEINMKEPRPKTSVETVPNIVSEPHYVHSPVGLYPVPIGRSTKLSATSLICAKFIFLGKFLAKAVMDSRMVDIPLSILCYKWLLNKKNTITWIDMEQVDPAMSVTFNKLREVLHEKKKIELNSELTVEERNLAISHLTVDGCKLEDLGLDFVLPGFPGIELMKSGSKQNLDINNLDIYVNLIAHWTLIEGVSKQLEALKEGFQSVFSLQSIDYFFPEELDQLFCGARYQPWNKRELADCCKTDHGYNHESEVVITLFKVLSQYDATEQRAFLQFVTGSPHLPVGGLCALHPPLTVVRKTCEEGTRADEYLPSVMTCVNYLKLPEYSNETVMKQRLNQATKEGQKSFFLS